MLSCLVLKVYPIALYFSGWFYHKLCTPQSIARYFYLQVTKSSLSHQLNPNENVSPGNSSCVCGFIQSFKQYLYNPGPLWLLGIGPLLKIGFALTKLTRGMDSSGTFVTYMCPLRNSSKIERLFSNSSSPIPELTVIGLVSIIWNIPKHSSVTGRVWCPEVAIWAVRVTPPRWTGLRREGAPETPAAWGISRMSTFELFLPDPETRNSECAEHLFLKTSSIFLCLSRHE